MMRRAGVTATLVVVGLVTAGCDDGDDDREAIAAEAPASTTTTAATSTTSTTTSSTSTTVPPTATATTEAPVVCRNSRDPVCGEFYWDPVPANQPVTFDVTFDPAQPVAGQPVTMTVEAHDPEAGILIMGSGETASCRPGWGDGTSGVGGCIRTVEQRNEHPPRTGPWDPPPPVGASTTGFFQHTYAQPGTYTVTVRAMPLTSLDVKNSDYDVYGGSESHTVTITVG